MWVDNLGNDKILLSYLQKPSHAKQQGAEELYQSSLSVWKIDHHANKIDLLSVTSVPIDQNNMN